MADHIQCPECRRVVQVPEEFYGRNVRCPECQAVFVAGAEHGVTAAAPRANITGASAEVIGTQGKRWYEAEDDSLGISLRYQSSRPLAVAVQVMLGVNLLISVVILGSEVMQYNLATRLLDGARVLPAEIRDNDVRGLVLTVLQLVIYIATGIIFLAWFQRAHANLTALGAQNLTYTSGWAIGSWFVPILNLFRPVQIAQEIWRNSDPDGLAPEETRIHTAEDSSLIGFWWGLWIINLVLSQVSMRVSNSVNSPESLQTATLLAMAAEVVRMIAAALALAVVRAIDVRQTVCAGVLASRSEFTDDGDDRGN